MPGPVGNDSERFRTVPGSQVYLNLIVLQILRLRDYIILIVFLHIDLRTMLPYGRDFIFSAWQVKTESKKLSPHISEALIVSGARTCESCGSGKLPFQHVLLPFGAAGGLMSQACSYYLRV